MSGPVNINIDCKVVRNKFIEYMSDHKGPYFLSTALVTQLVRDEYHLVAKQSYISTLRHALISEFCPIFLVISFEFWTSFVSPLRNGRRGIEASISAIDPRTDYIYTMLDHMSEHILCLSNDTIAYMIKLAYGAELPSVELKRIWFQRENDKTIPIFTKF